MLASPSAPFLRGEQDSGWEDLGNPAVGQLTVSTACTACQSYLQFWLGATYRSDQLLVILIEASKNHVALAIIDVSLLFPVLVTVDETFSTTKKSHYEKFEVTRELELSEKSPKNKKLHDKILWADDTEQGAKEMSASTAAPAAYTWELEFREINLSSETQTLYTSYKWLGLKRDIDISLKRQQMYRKQVEEHLPVHKDCSWSACSTLSPSGLDIQNTHSNTVFGKWFCSCSEASGIIAHGTPGSYLRANYLSLCYCHALWKKSSIRRCFLCHMNLQWTRQGASHCSTRHLHLLTDVNKDTQTSGRQGGTALPCPALPVFRATITLWVLHGAVMCNWEQALGGWAAIPAQNPLQFSCAESALFAWLTKMRETCKIWCCRKIIYVQAQKKTDELHWERAELGKQAMPVRMKLNLDKHNIKHIERNDLSYKYTQMVPELATISCNKELDFVANSSQSAQRLGKQKHLSALRMNENCMFKIRACTYMSTYGSHFQNV